MNSLPTYIIDALKIAARETTTDHAGDRWYTPGAIACQKALMKIESENEENISRP